MPSPRTVFITGASSGIGRALALEYASRGAFVAVAARRKDELDALVHEIESHGGRALAYPVDVIDADAIRDAVRKADADLGSLDMVVANAGIGILGHASRLRWEDVTRVIDVNLRGSMATLLAAVPIMLAQQRGHLVGVTSLAGRRGLPESGAYGASKAGLSTFLETLRNDLAAAGIRVTDVQPGFVATPITTSIEHPMPFVWQPEKAARVIARRLERAPALLAFPRPMAALTALARIMPAWLFDRLVRLRR
jgi:NADP-dependent 3-hydroxy acid dehydrogenase YdfG